VRIIALSLESSGTARLVVDRVSRATEVLSRHQVLSEGRDVLCTVVPSRAVAPVLIAAADADINLEYAYASSVDGDDTMALVLGVEDAPRAAVALGI
jgi:hypothetical protein